MFAAVLAEVDAVRGRDYAGASAAELNAMMRELEQVQRRLAAVTAELTGAWDAACAWYDDGAASGATWLRTAAKLDDESATRGVRMGRSLRAMPATAAALAAGEISADQAWMLVRARTARTTWAFERDETLLVGKATDPELSMRAFRRTVQYWKLGADADGWDRHAARQQDQRGAHLSQSFDGWWFGEFGLPPVAGAIVNTTLQAIERELFDQDLAELRARFGDNAVVADLGRTSPQRRADALVEMATRARMAPRDGRRPQPLFTVLVGYDSFATMICELGDGTVVPPRSLVAHLPDGVVERIVFDGPSRVIDVGEQRTYRGALRRAIQVRDRECTHPLCDAPAQRCQVDHQQRRRDGGPTTQANGRLLCRFHNLDRERRPDGGPAP